MKYSTVIGKEPVLKNGKPSKDKDGNVELKDVILNWSDEIALPSGKEYMDKEGNKVTVLKISEPTGECLWKFDSPINPDTSVNYEVMSKWVGYCGNLPISTVEKLPLSVVLETHKAIQGFLALAAHSAAGSSSESPS